MSAGLGEEPRRCPEGHRSPSNKGSPADEAQVLPAHLCRGVSPPAAAVAFSTPLGFFSSSTKPHWDSLDFLPALSPACSYYQQRRSCPVLSLLLHQHETSLCPNSAESHTAEPRLPDPCLCLGRGRDPPPRGFFGDLPVWPLPAPPVPRQITACPRLPFPGTPWAGTRARRAAAATASACRLPRDQHASQPCCPSCYFFPSWEAGDCPLIPSQPPTWDDSHRDPSSNQNITK